MGMLHDGEPGNRAPQAEEVTFREQQRIREEMARREMEMTNRL